MEAVKPTHQQTNLSSLLLPSVQVSSKVGSASSATDSVVSEDSSSPNSNSNSNSNSNLTSKTATLKSDSGSNNSGGYVNSQAIDSVSSYQLASKLRKIKENLDNCYLSKTNSNSVSNTNIIADMRPVEKSPTSANPHLYKIPIHHNKPLAKDNQSQQLISASVKNQILPNHSPYRDPKLAKGQHEFEIPLYIQPFKNGQANPLNTNIINTKSITFAPSAAVSIESLSKYVNSHNRDFVEKEAKVVIKPAGSLSTSSSSQSRANKHASLNNLIEQTSTSFVKDASGNNGFSHSKVPIPLTNNHNAGSNSVNNNDKNLLFSHCGNTNGKMNHSMNNINSYIPAYHMNCANNAKDLNSLKQAVKNVISAEVQKLNKPVPAKLSPNHPPAVNGHSPDANSNRCESKQDGLLKKAIFVENVSRQSSIRSLINSAGTSSTLNLSHTKATNGNSFNPSIAAQNLGSGLGSGLGLVVKADSGSLSNNGFDGVFVSSNKGANNESNGLNHFTKFKPAKCAKTSVSSTNLNDSENGLLPLYSRTELDLLKDWDKFNNAKRASIDREGAKIEGGFNPTNKVPDRPQTRLGFQDKPQSYDKNPNVDHSENTLPSSSNNSTSSKSFQDVSEEYSMEIPLAHLRNQDNSKGLQINSSASTEKAPAKPADLDSSNDLSTLDNESAKDENIDDDIDLDDEEMRQNMNENNEDSDSILSEFMTNLKFEDLSMNSPMPAMLMDKSRKKAGKKEPQINISEDGYVQFQEVESVDCNDNDESYLIDENANSMNNTKATCFSSNSQQFDFRERGESGKHINLADIKERYQSHFEEGRVWAKRNDREKNYQRLSNSINDLFTNLLQQLDRQKRKDYMELSTPDQYASSSKNFNKLLTGAVMNGQHSNNELDNMVYFNKNFKYTDKASEKRNSSAQPLSQTNNLHSDSDFIVYKTSQIVKQDSVEERKQTPPIQQQRSPNLMVPTPSSSGSLSPRGLQISMPHTFSNSKYDAEHSNTDRVELSKKKAIAISNNLIEEFKFVKLTNNGNGVSNSTSNNSVNTDASLLERYLNNEQLVGIKHAQVETVLQRAFGKNTQFTHDYSMIEYILNQESISRQTFKALIREKFEKYDWSEEVLFKLYEIINQPVDRSALMGQLRGLENGQNVRMPGGMPHSRRPGQDEEAEKDDEFDEEDIICGYEDGIINYSEDDSDENDDEVNELVNGYENEKGAAKSIEAKILENEKRVNNVIKQLKHNQHLNDFANSPASSAKSHRKLKDIKINSTTKKKQLQLYQQHQMDQLESESYGNFNCNSVNYSEMLGNTSTSSYFNNRYSSVTTTNFNNNPEHLKQSLSNSFAKRRQRKGSLPEINTNHILGADNNNFDLQSSSYLSFVANNTNSLNGFNTNSMISENFNQSRNTVACFNSSSVNYFKRKSDKYNSCRSFENDQSQHRHLSRLEEASFTRNNLAKKNAFVLEVLRNSMFRSKSLTDLNSSIVKIEGLNGANILNNERSQRNSNRNQFNDTSLNNTNFSFEPAETFVSNSALSKLSSQTIKNNNNTSMLSENPADQTIMSANYQPNSSDLNMSSVQALTNGYSGLVWQCADMAYDEFKNKYEELKWLMTGDIPSSSTKLKEVEQRLKIELNLKEKNINMISDIHNSAMVKKKTPNKAIQDRLESQLKIIDSKIKELESMRLFLRICEMNTHGLDPVSLDAFFNYEPPSDSQQQDGQNQHQKPNSLQGKSFYDILKSLYGFDAICNGFVYQFFVTYRYICSSFDLFEFFKDNFERAYSSYKTNDKHALILERTIDLLAMWLDGFYIIDFQQNLDLASEVERFIENNVKLFCEEKSRLLLDLLFHPSVEFNLFAQKDGPPFMSYRKQKKANQQTKKVNRLLNGALKKKIITNSQMASSKLCNKSKSNDTLLNSTDGRSSIHGYYRRDSFSIHDHPLCVIASQLTLIEWDNFLDIHVCHCLNSKAQGVNCDSKQPIDPNNINSEQCLFVDNYLSKSVYKMIQFNYSLSHWVSGEILLVDSIKSQANLISKFLKIAKKCYEWSNFSSTFSIYEGLQEITVRNLPAWQHVPTKTMHILEKIASLKLLFQNEPFLLYKLSKTTHTPVIPSMHLFLLQVQQNERGNFQLANGQWKWSKLNYLASLVDQIRIVQQHYSCNFEPFEEFVEELMQRIYYLKEMDLNQLAENNSVDYQGQKLNVSTNSTIMNLIPLKKRLT